MPNSGHPLAPLLGPLRYVCAGGFENLCRVKNLRTPLQAAIARARGAVPASVVAALASELECVDSAVVADRRASLMRLVAALKSEGLAWDPTEARAGSGVPLGMGATATMAPRRASAEARAGRYGAPRQRSSVDASGDDGAPVRTQSGKPRVGPLAEPLSALGRRLGPKLASGLRRNGLQTVGDVLFHLPRSYEDRRQLQRISQLRAGERSTFMAEVRLAAMPIS
jgi:hypothetical protein